MLKFYWYYHYPGSFILCFIFSLLLKMFQLKNLKKISPEDKKQNIAIKILYETNTTNTLSANLSSLQ